MSQARILCLSHSVPLAKIFDDAHIETIEWPQAGVRGSDADAAITAACSHVGGAESFDCVIGSYVPCAPVLYHLRRAGYSGPVVFVPHTNPYPLRNFLHTLLTAQVWGSADLVIVGSRTSADLYESLFGMETLVLPTFGIDTLEFTSRDRRESRRRLGLDGHRYILYSGRLAPDKNIDALLQTYESLRRMFETIRLILCFEHVDTDYTSGLIRRHKHLGANLGDTVVLRGVSPGLMPFVYSAADLCVSCATSYYETFGRAPLESVACGTPVVVPAWNGFREHVSADVGKLTSVEFLKAPPIYAPWAYAAVDVQQFVAACVEELQAPRSKPIRLEARLSFAETRDKLREAVHGLIGKRSVVTPRSPNRISVGSGLAERIVRALGIATVDELMKLVTAADYRLPLMGNDFRREFHSDLFN